MEAKLIAGIIILIIGIAVISFGIGIFVNYSSSISFSLFRGLGAALCFVGGCLIIIGLYLVIYGRKKD